MVRALASHQCYLDSLCRRHIYVGWVCFWFSPLLREVFLRVLRFSPPHKNTISKFQFDEELGRRRTTLWMCYLQIIIYLFILLQGMNHTVLLHCPISAEIRTVDSQSDLRILSWLCLIEKDLVRIIQLKHSPFSPTPLCTLLTPQNFA